MKRPVGRPRLDKEVLKGKKVLFTDEQIAWIKENGGNRVVRELVQKQIELSK